MQQRIFSCGLCLLLLACSACHKATDKLEPVDGAVRNSFTAAAASVEPMMPTAVARGFERSCKACHGPAGQGIAAVAPDIRKANPRTVEQWVTYLTSEHPGATLPPPTWLNADEIKAVANYLVSLHTPSIAPPVATEDDKSVR